MIDLKKLREKAEAANTAEMWYTKSDLVSCSYDYDKAFIEQVSPSTVVELLDMLEAAQAQASSNKLDAECFRWWVHEAANAPVGLAKAIAHCITEDEYREVICGAMEAKNKAIDAAMRS